MQKTSLCVLPELKGYGGPSSFFAKLKKGLEAQGIEVHHNIRRPSTKSLLVIGGTRKFGALLYAKRRGMRIVQRLDGMNWLHKKSKTGLAHYLRSERMNLQLAVTRRYFAHAIAYQSKFTRDWWNTVYGALKTPNTVIYNAVDPDNFTPGSSAYSKNDPVRLLVVEGSFKGGHERDLQNAIDLANNLAGELAQPVELLVAGKVPDAIKDRVANPGKAVINWLGKVPHEDIAELDRSAHLFYPAEINAACPNSLIEALSCGLPVVTYATGSLPELVGDDGGAVVPYNGDFWHLQAPDSQPLAKVAAKVLENLPAYRQSARKRAEKLFNTDLMVEKYKQILFNDLDQIN